MPVNIKIQEPNGQYVTVVAHYTGEMENFLTSIDLNRYNIERNVFGVSVNKSSAVFANVNFRSSNNSLGATGYNGRSASNLTGVVPPIYYLEITPNTELDRQIQLNISESMQRRLSGTQGSTLGTPDGGGNMLVGGQSREIVIRTELDWRQLNIHQVTERRIETPPRRTEPQPPVIGPPLVYEPPQTRVPDPPTRLGSGQIYVPFYTDDITTSVDNITGPLWSCDERCLTAFFTASNPTLDYKLDVYNSDPSITESWAGDTTTAEHQFSIIYGDYDGSGSVTLGGDNDETLTKAMYMQYRNILLPKGQEKFEIGGSAVNTVFIIDVKRDRYRSIMDPGDWELTLADGTVLVDSSLLENKKTTFTNKVYDIRSGSIVEGVNESETTVYGNFYPNHGMLVLSPSAIGISVGRNTNTSNENTELLFDNITSFCGRYIYKKYNKLCFVRVNSQKLNYSNNPTYTTGSEGEIIDELNGQNLAYYTTIGIFNETKELLAVGKISRAMRSDFKDEALYAVKIGH